MYKIRAFWEVCRRGYASGKGMQSSQKVDWPIRRKEKKKKERKNQKKKEEKKGARLVLQEGHCQLQGAACLAPSVDRCNLYALPAHLIPKKLAVK